MKTFNFFLVSLLLINAFVSQSSQESPELKEAAALTESVVQLFNERKFDEALRAAKRALEIRERLLAKDDPLIANSLSYVADVYVAKRNYGEATKVLERLLQNLEQRFGPEDMNVAATLERLALVDLRERRFAKAEATYQRALALKEKQFKTENVEVARTLVGLADVYRARNDFARGAPIYKRALSIYGQLSGVTSVEFQRTSERFACLAYENDKRDSVKDLTDIWKRFAPSDAPSEPPEVNGLNPEALTLPKPDLPLEAIRRRIEGIVVVKVKIDETGRVISAADMCQGPPYLSESAVSAARFARFSPTIISGKPVKVTGVIKYRFVN